MHTHFITKLCNINILKVTVACCVKIKDKSVLNMLNRLIIRISNFMHSPKGRGIHVNTLYKMCIKINILLRNAKGMTRNLVLVLKFIISYDNWSGLKPVYFQVLDSRKIIKCDFENIQTDYLCAFFIWPARSGIHYAQSMFCHNEGLKFSARTLVVSRPQNKTQQQNCMISRMKYLVIIM